MCVCVLNICIVYFVCGGVQIKRVNYVLTVVLCSQESTIGGKL